MAGFRLLWKWALVIGLCLTSFATVLASYPLRQAPYINDYARLLTPQTTAALQTMLAEMHQRSEIEMSIITIQSMRDYETNDATIEAFADRLFNRWGLGNAFTDKGVLMVVAVQDRKVRIELGDGYGTAYDNETQAVINDYILPAFRAGDYNKGIERGVKAMIHTVTGSWATGGQLTLLDDPRLPYGLGGAAALAVALMGFGGYSYFRHKCPECGKSVLRIRGAVMRAPTYSHGGEKEIHRDCPACGFHDERVIMLGALTRLTSGNYYRNRNGWGGGDSGSSGGGSSGGGSSGGGATGSW